jgi:hypothetical protein
MSAIRLSPIRPSAVIATFRASGLDSRERLERYLLTTHSEQLCRRRDRWTRELARLLYTREQAINQGRVARATHGPLQGPASRTVHSLLHQMIEENLRRQIRPMTRQEVDGSNIPKNRRISVSCTTWVHRAGTGKHLSSDGFDDLLGARSNRQAMGTNPPFWPIGVRPTPRRPGTLRVMPRASVRGRSIKMPSQTRARLAAHRVDRGYTGRNIRLAEALTRSP